MRIAALTALIALIALPFGATAGAYRTLQNVVYTPPDWSAPLAADVYIPEGGAAGLYPGVLVVHGGGWEGRDRSDMNGIARRLAERGFAVMNVSYRFAPAFRFPAQLNDVQQAVSWMRTEGRRHGIDPQRVGGFGYSSGAHLVSLLATLGEGDPLDKPYGGAETRLQAVVAGGLPADLRKFIGGRLVPQLLGTTLAENPALFEEASPIAHVSRGDPPMFIYHGGGDTTVDPSHAADMKRALDAAGVRSELRIVPVLGHVLTFLLARGTEDEGMDFLQSVLGAPK